MKLSRTVSMTEDHEIKFHHGVAFVKKTIVTVVNGRKRKPEVFTFFVERKLVEPPAKITGPKLDVLPRFLYYSDANKKALWEAFAGGGTEYYDAIRHASEETEKIQDPAGLEGQRFMRFGGDDHSMWRPGADVSVSRPIFIDSCVTHINNKDFDLDLVEEILAKNERVTNVTRDLIPYYFEREYPETHHLTFGYEFPQKVWNKLWREYHDGLKKGETAHFQGRIVERLAGWACLEEKEDLLKLKKARKRVVTG